MKSVLSLVCSLRNAVWERLVYKQPWRSFTGRASHFLWLSVVGVDRSQRGAACDGSLFCFSKARERPEVNQVALKMNRQLKRKAFITPLQGGLILPQTAL